MPALLRRHLPWVAVGFVVLVAAVVLLVRRGPRRRAVFPSKPPIARLPIRAPLVRPELTVMATLRVNEKRASSVWMMVDSGATGVTLPSSTYFGLGLDVLSGVTIRSEDPFGRPIHREAGEIPQVAFGALQVEDVVAAIGGSNLVVGQSILAHDAWDIDWDRGLLTLGGAAWKADAETIVLPVRTEADGEVVTASVDGAKVDLIVDTGALVSTIPERVGAEAHLAMRRVPPTTLDAVGGDVVVRHVFSGETRLGPLSLGRHEFAAVGTGGRRARLGLLGLDVLSRYRLQVVPGVQIALRPRGDVRAVTKERIARWAFVPTSCAHAGCVHAELVADGDDARLTATLEADLGSPIEVLLGCANDASDTFVPTGSSFAFAAPEGSARHVHVRLPSRTRGDVFVTKIPGGAAWFQGSGAECTTLEPLDVSPLAPIGAGAIAPDSQDTNVVAAYWP